MSEPNWTLFFIACVAIVALTVAARILAERWRWIGIAWLCSVPFLALLVAWAVLA